jgi:hypothetical protein
MRTVYTVSDGVSKFTRSRPDIVKHLRNSKFKPTDIYSMPAKT